MLLFLPWLLD